MINKKITLLIITASSLAFGTGCSKNAPTINGVDVIDIADAKVDSTKSYERTITSVDPKDIERYDNLEIASKKVTIDAKNLEYILDITFKNKSKKPIDNLSINLALYSPNENTVDSIEVEELKPNDTIEKTLVLSLDGMVNEYFNGQKPTKKQIEKALKSYAQDDNDFIKFDYSYKDVKSNRTISIGYDFGNKFKVLNNSIKISKVLNEEEQDKLSVNHKDNGTYLNLVNPDMEEEFSDIKILNLSTDFDDDYNLNIKATLKNTSKEKLKDFQLNCHAYINELTVPLYLSFGAPNSNIDIIKPNEEVEIDFTISKDDFFSTIDKEYLYQLPLFKGSTITKVLSNSLINREVTFKFNCNYNIDDYNVNMTNHYDSNSKLVTVNINKYNFG